MSVSTVVIFPVIINPNMSDNAKIAVLVFLGVLVAGFAIATLISEIVYAVRKATRKKVVARNRCKGITKKGSQCMNDLEYCNYHREANA